MSGRAWPGTGPQASRTSRTFPGNPRERICGPPGGLDPLQGVVFLKRTGLPRVHPFNPLATTREGEEGVWIDSHSQNGLCFCGDPT